MEATGQTAQGLLGDFLRWSRNTKGNTAKWVAEQRRYMNWWVDDLPSNVRAWTLDAIEGAIPEPSGPTKAGKADRAAKIRVLKAFYSWLIKVARKIEPHDDPMFRKLTTPQNDPEQWDRSKLIPHEQYLAVRAKLSAHYRHGPDVLAGTGWHVTELVRFSRAGSCLPPPAGTKQTEVAGVLVCPQTKGGDTLRVAHCRDSNATEP